MSVKFEAKRGLFAGISVTIGFLIVLAVAVGNGRSTAANIGVYTSAQATQGQNVYAGHCEVCHGASLQGGAGPTLVGSNFRRLYVSSGKKASELYDFISKQMPADAPGTLSKQDYLSVEAFLLSKNGYAAGDVPLSAKNLNQTLPASTMEATPGNSAGNTNEIVRAAQPIRHVYAALPAGADVNVSNAMLATAGTDQQNWLTHGRSYANDRYSSLSQIDTSNVQSLVPIALLQTAMPVSFETTPLVINGVMYITTGIMNNQMKIMALNAATGQRLWDTTYILGSYQICCGPVNRGVAAAYGKLYAVTLDDKLLAIDATNGKVLWETSVANAKAGYSETMTPQVYDGLVIIGSAGAEWPLRGFVAAYDAQTGKQMWRWNSTDPKSYAGDSWKRGGATVWNTPAIDPKLGLAIFSTSNPNPDLNGGYRKGDNLYSDSIVALDVRTGKLRWYYQEVKHDVWDYDAASSVVLFDVNEDGKTVPAAGEAGKVGWFFIVDRRTGKLIRKSEPFVLMSKNMFSMPTKAGVAMLPGANGGSEWSEPAYSPQTHMVYVLGMDQLMNFTTAPAPYTEGKVRLGSAFTNIAKNGIQDGRFVAINVDTGKIGWTYKAPQPFMGGALATAGGLVFTGEGNGWFEAFNAQTGAKLWRFNLGAGVNAPPVSYEVNGVQYIAVGAGGNFQLNYPYGDTVAIFRLGSAGTK